MGDEKPLDTGLKRNGAALPLRVLSVFGTRPEAIKLAPVLRALQNRPRFFQPLVVVTAQHREMLDQVLSLFALAPHYDLNIMQERQTLAEITVRSLAGLDGILARERPDLVLVQGDTTTAFVAGLAAFYRRIPVGHVEAGLRTRRKYEPFPEEINRRLLGALADLHFAPTAQARENLLAESVPPEAIHVTGNTVVDALQMMVRSDYRFADPALERAVREGRRILLATAHRRENWGEPLESICLALRDLVRLYPDVTLVFPVHRNPAVRETVERLLSGEERVVLTEPLDYREMANLLSRAYLILTDSGGLQEEAPGFGRPVLVLREVTERPEGVACGVLKLVGTSRERIVSEARTLLEDRQAYLRMARAANPYGDGRAAERIAEILLYRFGWAAAPPAEFTP
ncbi:MAG: UDP-N-acetylglucosamine 2-epimerase (non-hydrolyzing) [Bacillota bacterium]|nr:UDP-N-acetylglucosamine 2-epimerase (non-hydrolyzing) [Bacillota bacterium]